MPFDDDPEVEGSGVYEAPETQDMFGNLQAVENTGGGFNEEEEGRVDPESLTPPPEEQAPSQQAEPMMVPMHALHEERRARYEMQKELQAHREMAARFDERMRILHEQQQQAAAAEQARLQAEWEAQQEPEPDPNEDPLGHQMWQQDQRLNQQARELEELRGYQQQVDQVFQGQALDGQVNQVADWTRTREAQYRAVRPDYDHAYRYLLRSRAEEYNAIGMTPEQIQARLQRDQGEVVALSTQYDQNGTPVGMPGNPCDTIYRLAIQRGFVPGSTQTDAAGTVIQQNGNGAGTWNGYGRVDGRGRLEAAQRGMRQSPSGRGGTTTTAPLNYATISRMSDAEVAQLSATPQGRRLLDVAMGSR